MRARARRRPRGRAADLSPPARDDRARGARARRRGVLDTDFPAEPKFDRLPERAPAPAASRAFLTVQEGCDKFCTFCVVPYTRGAEYSRPAARRRAPRRGAWSTRGAREITLLGPERQRLSRRRWRPTGESWGLGAADRAARRDRRARRASATRPAIPRDMDDDLIAAHGDVPKLMPFLHLPVQSGSDRVLTAMNRRHTRRRLSPHWSSASAARGPTSRCRRISSSAFPARATAISRATLDLVREVGFAQAFSFKYSARGPARRPRRCASQMPEAVKAERLARLQALLRDQQRAFNAAMRRPHLPVLFEQPGRHDGPARRPHAPICSRCMSTAPSALIGAHRRGRDRRVGANSLAGRLSRRMCRRSSRCPLQPALQRAPGRASQRHPRRSPQPLHLQFDDNRLLPLLFGEHDQHLGAHRAAARRVAGVARQPARRSPAPPGAVAQARAGADRALSAAEARPRRRPAARSTPRSASRSRTRATEPSLVRQRRHRDPHPRAPHQPAHRRPRRTICEALREHELVFGTRPGRHRQDLSRGRRRGRPC